MGFTLSWWGGLRISITILNNLHKGWNEKIKPSKPNKNMIKTMKMSTIRNTNRTGIYVQKSAGVTTVGDGLALQGDKSPVTRKRERRCSIDEWEESSHKKRPTFSSPPHGPNHQQFTSPAIKAGVRESDSSYSKEFRLRNKDKFQGAVDLQEANKFKNARLKMGLKGRHIQRRQRSPTPPLLEFREFIKIYPEHKYPPKTKPQQKKFMKSVQQSEIEQKYPLEVQILDKSHIFMGIEKLNQSLLLGALETTIQDEYDISKGFIKIGPCQYKRKILNIRCKNIETVQFLKSNIPLYNLLWPGADLHVTSEQIFVKRHKVGVNLPNYNITSEEFFKVIGKQNNFRSKHWSLMHKHENGTGFRAIIGIDPVSFKRMEESDGYVHFFFDKIRLNL